MALGNTESPQKFVPSIALVLWLYSSLYLPPRGNSQILKAAKELVSKCGTNPMNCPPPEA
jgi:hypothetical protein